MFKIGEFSKLTHVSIRMLRYYDQIGLLKPALVQEDSGYRQYAAEQISDLKKIILLRDAKFPTCEIQKALQNWEESYLLEQLAAKKQQLKQEIQQELNRISQIELAIRDIKQNEFDTHCNITFKEIPAYPILSLRRHIPDFFSEGQLWQELYSYAEQHKISAVKSTPDNLAIYHDAEEYKEGNIDVEVGIVITGQVKAHAPFTCRYTKPVPLMASVMVYGPYENIADGYRQFAYWLSKHPQYQMTGKSRQTCHKGPYNESNPANYLTEIQIPVGNKI